jgi:hypothetical protein
MDQTETTPEIMTKNKQVKLYNPITTARAKKLGQELAAFAKANSLSTSIAGKQYMQVEGWQFTGQQLGLTQVVVECEPVAPFDIGDERAMKEIKYKATVEIVNQYGTVMSRGFAWCSNKETKKKSFDEYAIASMAQTRAIGKAYRNILSWIVKMAGYESTPAEEIDREAMEADLAKLKQEVLKVLNANSIIKGNEIMAYIEKVLGKRVIETSDDAYKIINSFEDNDETI